MEDGGIAGYLRDSSFQAYALAQLSKNAAQGSFSTMFSGSTLPGAHPSPLLHVEEHDVRQSSNIYSTSMQNSNSIPSDTSLYRPIWENSRSRRMASEHGDSVSEPERFFGQVCIPVREFKDLSQRRFAVLASRVNVREHRKKLRDQQEAVHEKIGCMLQELRISIPKAGKQHMDELLSHYEKLQKPYEELLAEDDEYDLLEKGLIDLEWHLRLAEDTLYDRSPSTSSRDSHSFKGKSPLPGSLRNSQPQSATHQSAAGSEVFSQGSHTPSEVELVRAKLRRLESEHMELREEEHLRRTLGLTLDEDSSFTLRVFPVRQAELLHYLSFHEERAKERQQILDDSVDQFPTYQYTGHDLEVLALEGSMDGLPDSLDIISAGISSGQKVDMFIEPLLLSHAEQPNGAEIWIQSSNEHPYIPNHLAFINDWLLHILRYSRLAIMQLMNHIGETAISLDAQTLKSMVLSLWYSDETSVWFAKSAEYAPQSYNPSSISRQIQAAVSDRNLSPKYERLGPVRQSRSAFLHRSEVQDLYVDLSGLLVDKGARRI